MHTLTKGILLFAVVTVGVAAVGAADVAAAEDDLTINVTETDVEPVVTVTSNATAVENASVNATTVEGQNVTYVGEGDYETDANGTVTLEPAEEDVTINVTATVGNETAATTADLVAPSENEPANFGQLIREFIMDIDDRSGGIGDVVSEFATSNNPGNAPDHAGAPGNASDAPGNAGGNASDDRQGPPEHAGNGSEAGPPDHDGGNGSDDGASGGADDDGTESSSNGDGASDNGDDDAGPDNDIGPGNGAGSGNGGNGSPGNGAGPAT